MKQETLINTGVMAQINNTYESDLRPCTVCEERIISGNSRMCKKCAAAQIEEQEKQEREQFRRTLAAIATGYMVVFFAALNLVSSVGYTDGERLAKAFFVSIPIILILAGLYLVAWRWIGATFKDEDRSFRRFIVLVGSGGLTVASMMLSQKIADPYSSWAYSLSLVMLIFVLLIFKKRSI